MSVVHTVLDIWGRYSFIRFVGVGILNAAFGYSLYALLIVLKFGYPVALLIATVIGVVFNYFTTGSIVFHNKSRNLFFRYGFSYVLIYSLNVTLLYFFIDVFGVNRLLAQLFALPLVTICNYYLNKLFVFKV